MKKIETNSNNPGDNLQKALDDLKQILTQKKFTGWLTEKETQELTGKKTTTLWKLRRDGKIRFAKIGNKIFYKLDSIEKLLEDNLEN